MSLPLALALLDGAVALYLLVHALPRHRRNRGPLLVTAVVLLLAALGLAWVGLLSEPAELGRLTRLPGQLV